MTGDDGKSVWQRALNAWREAGLEWQRPAGWTPADVDLQRTEPIPVVPASGIPPMEPAGSAPEQPPGPGGRAGPDSEGSSGEAGLDQPVPETGTGPDPEIAASGEPDVQVSGPAGDAPGAEVPGPAGDAPVAEVPGSASGEPEAGADVPEPGIAALGGVPEPRRSVESGVGALDLDIGPAITGGPAGQGNGAGRPEDAALAAAAAASGVPGRDQARPGREGATAASGRPEPRVPGEPSRRAGRGVLVGAGICVAVIAVAIAGIVITGPGSGSSGGPSALIVTSPSAVLADAQFAGPGGTPTPAVPPSLTGIAAVGSTVVAVGAQATVPTARP
ncbi:MAG TPA: hypothetical protein VIX86_19585, partial [Streptosporangiaceae bacterium]